MPPSKRNPTIVHVRKCPRCGKRIAVEFPRGATVLLQCIKCNVRMYTEEFVPEEA